MMMLECDAFDIINDVIKNYFIKHGMKIDFRVKNEVFEKAMQTVYGIYKLCMKI